MEKKSFYSKIADILRKKNSVWNQLIDKYNNNIDIENNEKKEIIYKFVNMIEMDILSDKNKEYVSDCIIYVPEIKSNNGNEIIFLENLIEEMLLKKKLVKTMNEGIVFFGEIQQKLITTHINYMITSLYIYFVALSSGCYLLFYFFKSVILQS